MTNIVTKSTYALFKKICLITHSMKLLEHAGVIIIICIIMFWYLFIWLGSSLMLYAVPDAIIHEQTQAPASFIETAYYTGYTLSTLGVGDFVASTHTWQIFTVLLALAGFVLLTTGISYMLPVLSAAVFKRSVSSYIAALGANPLDILQKQWQNGHFPVLGVHFNKLTEMLVQHNQELLAYPVVYCFYTTNPKKASALNIGKLDEVLTILISSVSEEHRPPMGCMYPLREAISDYLIIQRNFFIKQKDAHPAVPSLDPLRRSGIPLLQDHLSIQQEYQRLSKRRKLIGAILENEARNFDDIYQERSEDDTVF